MSSPVPPQGESKSTARSLVPLPGTVASFFRRANLSEQKRSLSAMYPFVSCKISCRNLPQYDYFSQSDPLCVVKYARITSGSTASSANASSAVEIFRSEVVANDSNPEFSSNFRFQPQKDDYKEQKNDAGPMPATLVFEIYDSRMRDAYRDSKNLVPKPSDLLGRVEFRLDEIFQKFIDMVADDVFKEQMEKDAHIKGARHYREDFMKAIRENRETDKLMKFVESPANVVTVGNMSWSLDKELSVPQASTQSMGRNSAILLGKCCGANFGLDVSPTISLNFVCIPSDGEKGKKSEDGEKGKKSEDDPIKTDVSLMMIQKFNPPDMYDYGLENEDAETEENSNESSLAYSNLIPYRASDMPSIKQQVQRFRANRADVPTQDSISVLMEKALGEFKELEFMATRNDPQKFHQASMIRLRTLAFKNPRQFYNRGPVGEPFTVYGFLLGLHTFREEPPSHLIINFWQILCFVKLGLLRSLLDVESEAHRDVSMAAELTRRYKTAELRHKLQQKYFADLKKPNASPNAAKITTGSTTENTEGKQEVPGSQQDQTPTLSDNEFVLAWIDSLVIGEDFKKPLTKAEDCKNRKFSDIVKGEFKLEEKSSANGEFVATFIIPLLKRIIEPPTNKPEQVVPDQVVNLICAIECEFQWLLCQEYSPNIYSLEDLLVSTNTNGTETCTVINEYSGENLLHLLIIRGNLDHIKTLSNAITSADYRQVMLNAKVTGRFFCPVYGEVHYGQTPLHFAISTGQIHIVKHLLECWCPDDMSRYFCLWQKDSRGNSVLHLCVLKSLTTMYDFLEFSMKEIEKCLKRLEWWHHESRLTISDDDCLKNGMYNTPIELAAIVGNERMLSHLIRKEKGNFGWSYGSATLAAIRVRDIDSYKTLTCPRVPEYLSGYTLSKSEARTTFFYRSLMARLQSRNEVEPSVLSILIEKEQKKLLNIPVIQGLIEFKWMTFGRQLLRCWAFVAFAVFILFEIVCYNLIYPSDRDGLTLASNTPFSVVEIALYVVAALFLFCRQYFQLDLGIAIQKSESSFATFNPDQTALPRCELVYPSHPSWKLGFKLKETLESKRSTPGSSTLEKFADKMLSNPFRTQQVQPYFVTQGLDVKTDKAVSFGKDLRPFTLFSKLLWRVTFQDMMKEGGFWGVAWAILVLLSGIIRLTLPSDRKLVAEQVALALASVCIFFYMTGFYSFSDKLGPFMVLLQHMFMDLAKWLSITLLFFLGYAQAMLIVTSDTSISAFGTYKWLLGDSTTDYEINDIIQGVIIFLFISYSILVSISLVNILTAMFGSTYGEIMENSKETWFLEYARNVLLLERVLYFLPSWILWLIGFRVLHPRNANQRKVILRFVYRDGYANYEWIDTRCGIRYQLSRHHAMSLQEHQKDELDRTSLSTRQSPFLAFWRARVTKYDVAYFQPTNDDDQVFLLQLEKNSSLKKLYGRNEKKSAAAAAEQEEGEEE